MLKKHQRTLECQPSVRHPANAIEFKLWKIFSQQLQRTQLSVDELISLNSKTLPLIIMRLRDEWPNQNLAAWLAMPFTLTKLAQQLNATHYASSSIQQRLWLCEQEDVQRCLYQVAIQIELCGALDEKKFNRAFTALIQRHDSLHAHFEVSNQEPTRRDINSPFSQQTMNMVIIPEYFSYTLIDLSNTENPQHCAENFIKKMRRKKFQYQDFPLWRGALLKLAAQRHWLVVVFHHSIFDGWSIQLFLRELSLLYDDRAELTPAIQYAEFIQYQQQYFSTATYQHDLQFWKHYLADFEPLSWPLAKTLPNQRGESYVTTIHRLPYLLTTCQRYRLSLYMLLHAALILTLHQYCEQQDIIIGTACSTRHRPEFESMIGCLIETLPIRVAWQKTPTIEEFLELVKRNCLQAFDHCQVPFTKIIELFPAQASKLITMLLVLQPSTAAIEFKDLTIHELTIPEENAKFDLAINIIQKPEELTCQLEYNPDLFNQAAIQRFAQHFSLALDNLCKLDKLASIHDINFITKDEKRLFAQINDTYLPYKNSLNTSQFIERTTRQYPDNIALVFQQTQLTYQELNTISNQWAHLLLDYSLPKSSIIGICLPRSAELIISIIASLKAGLAFVPLDITPEDQQQCCRKIDMARCAIILVNHETQALIPNKYSLVINIDSPDFIQRIAQCRKTNPNLPLVANDLAMIPFTSGTTGQPKGVLIEHQGLCHWIFLQTHTLNPTPDEKIFLVAPFTFDAFLWDMLMALAHGGTLYLNDESQRINPVNLKTLFQQHHITTITLTPSLLATLNPVDFKSLKKIILTGESCQFDKAWLAQAQLYNAYGATETTIGSIAKINPEQTQCTAGFPGPNTHFYILNSMKHLTPLGGIGEIYIGGPIARGYLHDNHQRFTTIEINGFHEKVYRTGDKGCFLATGELLVLGRIDQQIKLHGVKLDLKQIEETLQQYPKAQQVFVTAFGEGKNQAIFAYMTGKSPEKINMLEIKKFLKQSGMPRQWIPSHIIQVDKFPITKNGKINTHELARYPTPEYQENPALNMNSLEKKIHAIWEVILHHGNFSKNDDFFDVGGRSLQAVQLLNKINQQFHLSMNLQEIKHHATISDLAGVIHQQQDKLYHSSEHAINQHNKFYKKKSDAGLKNSQAMPICLISASQQTHYYQALLDELILHYPCSTYAVEECSLITRKNTDFSLTLETIVNNIVQAMTRDYSPQRLCVIGWSLAGSLALKVAEKLTRLGVETYLVLIDALNPNLLLHYSPTPRINKLYQVLSTLTEITLPPDENFVETLLTQPIFQQVERLRDHFLPFCSTVEIKKRLQSFTTSLLALLASPLQKTTFSHGLLLLTQSTLQDYQTLTTNTDLSLGWENKINPLDTCLIEGDHFSILTKPDVEILAHEIKQWLTKRYHTKNLGAC
ncbi:MAG: AMP-binding protein [Legionellales bacterium]|nr:AMP-binding protein [Legionellales bacterium]